MGPRSRGQQLAPETLHIGSQHESTDNFCFLYLQLQEDLEGVNSSKNKRQNKTKSKHSAWSTLFLTFINNSGNVIMNAHIQDILFWAAHNHTWVPEYQRASHQYLSFTAAENRAGSWLGKPEPLLALSKQDQSLSSLHMVDTHPSPKLYSITKRTHLKPNTKNEKKNLL